ncbi:uncharacterized protein LOC142320344 [Lycorma delicatula]|uniref:uncharacterized protein LOC142320344 n=1 Tax=Lycorma delicatula TaxID=130591 RepID=UPI003F51A6AB
MAFAIKRKCPKFLLDYKKDLQNNEKALPLAVVKQKEQIMEEMLKISKNLLSGLRNEEKVVKEKTKQVSDKLKELNLLDQKLSKHLKESTDLEVQVKFMKEQINQIEKEIPDDSVITDLENKIVSLEKEHMNKKENFKKNHTAVLFIYDFYKKYLGCKLRFESPQVVKIEFSSSCYVILHSEDMKTNWTLTDIKPNVERGELEKNLMETDNVQALLACYYDSFKSLIKQEIQENKENKMEVQ